MNLIQTMKRYLLIAALLSSSLLCRAASPILQFDTNNFEYGSSGVALKNPVSSLTYTNQHGTFGIDTNGNVFAVSLTLSGAFNTGTLSANQIISTNPIVPNSYTVATLPGATTNTGAAVWITDAITPWGVGVGERFTSDGTNWMGEKSGIVATADMKTFMLGCATAKWKGATPYMISWIGESAPLSSATFGDFNTGTASGSVVTYTAGGTSGVGLSTSTSASGGAYTTLGMWTPSANDYVINCADVLIPTLSDTAEKFYTFVGIASTGVPSSASSRAGLIYDPQNTLAHGYTGASTNNWIAQSQASGVATNAVDTGIAVVTDATRVAQLVNYTNSWYYVNGTICATNISGPTAAVNLGKVVMSKSLGTTARLTNVRRQYSAIRWGTPKTNFP